MRVLDYPLPVPEPLAALPRRVVAPYGSLALSRDVAAAFGVQPSTLRKWRQAGKWPDAIWSEGNNPYYLVSELVPYYYDRFPNSIPDAAFGIGDLADTPLISKKPDAVTEADTELSTWRENGGAGSENGGAGRDLGGAASVAELVLGRIGETVKEAVRQLVEPVPESPAVIEAQAAIMDSQRQEIERLKQQVAELSAALEQERGWRERPWLDRWFPKA